MSELIEDQTICDLFNKACPNFGISNALCFPFEGKTYVFKELNKDVSCLAAGFLAIGLKPGDRIALFGGNHANLVVSIYAAIQATMIPVCLCPQLSGQQLLTTLKLLECRALLYFPSADEEHCRDLLLPLCPELEMATFPGPLKIAAAGPKLNFIVFDTEKLLTHTVEAERSRSAANIDAIIEIGLKSSQLDDLKSLQANVKPTDVAMIALTSGATEETRAVKLSHYQLINIAKIAGEKLAFPGGTICCQMPIFRSSVFALSALTPLIYGCTSVFPAPQPLPRAIVHAVEFNKCTHLMTSPTALRVMLRMPVLQQGDLGSLETVCLSGDYVPNDLFDVLHKILPSVTNISVATMLTEVGVPFVSKPGTSEKELIETQGQLCSPQYEAKVKDLKDASDLPPGSVGVLWCKPVGNSTFLGTILLSKNQVEVQTENNGFICTGDLAQMDDSGNIKLLGHRSDVLTANGNITPTQPVERGLSNIETSDIQSLQILPFEDKLVACVSLRDRNAKPGIKEELTKTLREACEKQKLPNLDHIVFVRDLPRTPTKKIQRHKLRQMLPKLIEDASAS